MKKLFFFRSSSGSSNNQVSPDGNEKCRSKSIVTENHAAASGPFLGRSRSTSSGAIFDGGCGWKDAVEQVESPRSSGHGSGKKSGRNSFCRATPEKQHPRQSFEVAARKADKRGPVPGLHYESSECDSYSSSNVSTGVLDRYIDGEQQPAKCASHRMLHSANFFENGNFLMEQQKQKCQSFRDIDVSESHFSSRDWPPNGGFGNESPRKLAKHVVERLSQSKFLPPKSSKEPDFDIPITVEDIYSQPSSKSPHRVPPRNSAPDESALDGFKGSFDAYLCEATTLAGRSSSFSDKCEVISSDSVVDDQKLFRQFKEVEDRAILFSEELEQESYLHQNQLSPPSMVHTIRGLNAERVNMAYETANILKNWITDRNSLREEVQMAKAELETKTRRLEKEKSELQSVLERELDRRSNEWSNKLDKYQSEEHRLRERVRELAEQNVFLQREISSFNERDTGLRNRATRSEQQVLELTTQVEQVKGDNRNLKQNLNDIQEKCKVAEEDRDCLSRNYEEKVKECKDLHRSITKLQRTCGEQEKSIDGLRSLCEEIQKNNPTDNHLKKLQLEHVRLSGMEYALRKEVETSRAEVDSLRHENINLLNRLKETGKEGGFSTFKIDQELWHRICNLQNQGLSYLADCAQLCRNLLEYIKRNFRQNTKGGLDGDSLGLGSQFIVESDVKLQGFSRGVENLTKSLSVVSTVLQEKSTVLLEKSEPATVEAESSRFNHKKSEDIILSELRAETMMTTLLREKLYSKDLEIEQLQAELAASVRGSDIIKSQVQNAVDTISCLTHQRKELELQMMKKDQNINQLQSELQDCKETLADVNGKLPKVEEERNMLWDEVKMYNEKNMLLNCEMNMLKKKIDAMDEDRLIKEGQITILKDALDKQPFDLLGNADHEFLVR